VDVPGAEVSVRFDETRIQMLLHIRKKGGNAQG